jgi:hypothetical protein
LQLAPNHAEAWSIRAEVMQLAGKLSAGLDAIARAINLQPQNPDFWLVQGRLLEEANRMDEAYQSFTRAIHLAGGEPGSQSPPLLDGLYLSRSGFLRRQNRLKEAAVDFCTAKHIAPRDPKVSPEVVDLTCYYNAALNDQWYATQEKNDLTSLPKGMQTLRGVVFDVRALIQVGAESATGEKYPAQVEGIQILRKCRKLHFLHSAINCFGIIEGTQIGSYCIHYANDQHLEIPLLVGKDLADGWSRSDHETAQFIVAWEATTAATRKPDQRARLFKTTWENPSPSLEIKSVDFLSTNAPAAPFLVAITVE